MRTQSRQKKSSRTIAVARCVAIRNVRKYLSFWWMFQPSSFGRITLCPRLETGNSSDTPCKQPQHDRAGIGDQRCDDHVARVVRFGPVRNQANTRQARPTRNAAIPCLAW